MMCLRREHCQLQVALPKTVTNTDLERGSGGCNTNNNFILGYMVRTPQGDPVGVSFFRVCNLRACSEYAHFNRGCLLMTHLHLLKWSSLVFTVFSGCITLSRSPVLLAKSTTRESRTVNLLAGFYPCLQEVGADV